MNFVNENKKRYLNSLCIKKIENIRGRLLLKLTLLSVLITVVYQEKTLTSISRGKPRGREKFFFSIKLPRNETFFFQYFFLYPSEVFFIRFLLRFDTSIAILNVT